MHILVLPLPLQGHVNPCLAVAKLLVPHGFTFTFVLPDHLAAKLNPMSSGAAAAAAAAAEGELERPDPPGIQYAAIPFEYAPTGSAFDFKTLLDMIDDIRPGVVTLLHKLASSPRRVSSIIADSFLTWSHCVASEFNVPLFVFYTTNAHTFTAMFHAQLLISNGLIPVRDPDRIVDCVPGLPPMRAGDLPQSIRTYPSFGEDVAKSVEKAAGIIINTVLELEREALEVMKSKLPIYSIGPMLLLGGLEKFEGESVGLWTEERGCLQWLDMRPASSVLFIAFGSIANISCNQIAELAEGLEASGQAFLWVIRSDAVKVALSTLLPEGFRERTKDKGLIVSWAPQLEVLSHPAIGGFFTHCGWNSVTENLSLGGAPMICWPHVAEQRLNKLLLVNKWKVGLELQEEDGFVKRAEVEKAVTQLMQGEVGRELRERVLEFKKVVTAAVQEGGSSESHLKALAQDIRKLGLMHSELTSVKADNLLDE